MIVIDLSTHGRVYCRARQVDLPCEEASPSIGTTVARFNDVHASGYNSAGSVRIRTEFGVLRIYCLEQILGAIRAEARAGDRTEILFLFVR